MIGIINDAVRAYICDAFGSDVWERVVEATGIEKSFVSACPYPDEVTYRALASLAEQRSLDLQDVLEECGYYFNTVYIRNMGYERLLRCMGANLVEFLQNLNIYHLHLSVSFKEMQPPAFNVDDVTPDSVIFHYTSKRPGLTRFTIGLLRGAAKLLYDTEVDITILQLRGEGESEGDGGGGGGAEHDTFLIRFPPQASIAEYNSAAATCRLSIDPPTLYQLFPFHMVIDAECRLVQVGRALTRMYPRMKPGRLLTEFFTLRHPYIPVTFERILEQSDNLFVLRSSINGMELKGQMQYLQMPTGGPDIAKLQSASSSYDSSMAAAVAAAAAGSGVAAAAAAVAALGAVAEEVPGTRSSSTTSCSGSPVFETPATSCASLERPRELDLSAIAAVAWSSRVASGRPSPSSPSPSPSPGPVTVQEPHSPKPHPHPHPSPPQHPVGASLDRPARPVASVPASTGHYPHLAAPGQVVPRTDGSAHAGADATLRRHGVGLNHELHSRLRSHSAGHLPLEISATATGTASAAAASPLGAPIGGAAVGCPFSGLGGAVQSVSSPVAAAAAASGGPGASGGGFGGGSCARSHQSSASGCAMWSRNFQRLHPGVDVEPVLLFLGSPRIGNVTELRTYGLYVSDLPLFDHSREMILMAEQRFAEAALKDTFERLSVQLEEERQRSEQLLYQMIPPHIADSLRRGQRANAETYPEATILFSDVVNFTTIAAGSTAMEVCNMLDNLYNEFDALIDKYPQVYKVETIGDAYMLVANVTQPCADHVDVVLDFALDMQTVCNRVTTNLGAPIQIRVGIHTGSVVGGVVGRKMPRFHLFGDAVNTASRMESHGLAGSVHISAASRALIRNPSKYLITERGEIAVKGKGLMETFLVSRADAPSVAHLRSILASSNASEIASAALLPAPLHPSHTPKLHPYVPYSTHNSATSNILPVASGAAPLVPFGSTAAATEFRSRSRGPQHEEEEGDDSMQSNTLEVLVGATLELEMPPRGERRAPVVPSGSLSPLVSTPTLSHLQLHMMQHRQQDQQKQQKQEQQQQRQQQQQGEQQLPPPQQQSSQPLSHTSQPPLPQEQRTWQQLQAHRVQQHCLRMQVQLLPEHMALNRGMFRSHSSADVGGRVAHRGGGGGHSSAAGSPHAPRNTAAAATAAATVAAAAASAAGGNAGEQRDLPSPAEDWFRQPSTSSTSGSLSSSRRRLLVASRRTRKPSFYLRTQPVPQDVVRSMSQMDTLDADVDSELALRTTEGTLQPPDVYSPARTPPQPLQSLQSLQSLPSQQPQLREQLQLLQLEVQRLQCELLNQQQQPQQRPQQQQEPGQVAGHAREDSLFGFDGNDPALFTAGILDMQSRLRQGSFTCDMALLRHQALGNPQAFRQGSSHGSSAAANTAAAQNGWEMAQVGLMPTQLDPGGPITAPEAILLPYEDDFADVRHRLTRRDEEFDELGEF